MISSDTIAAQYLEGISIDNLSKTYEVDIDTILQALASEAIQLHISEKEIEGLGLIDGKAKCSMCKRMCQPGDLSSTSWLFYMSNQVCCKICRYKKDISKKFDMTFAEVDILLASQTTCAICNQTEPDRKLCIDHDHVTGKVRGLLCNPCNTALGLFKDNLTHLQRAIDYLSR